MTFQLTHPPSDPNYCERCERTVRSMKAHQGSAVCQKRARELFLGRNDLVRSFDEPAIFRSAGVTSIFTEDSGGNYGHHTVKWAANANRVMANFDVPATTRSRLLADGPDGAQLKRMLALIALAGGRRAG